MQQESSKFNDSICSRFFSKSIIMSQFNLIHGLFHFLQSQSIKNSDNILQKVVQLFKKSPNLTFHQGLFGCEMLHFNSSQKQFSESRNQKMYWQAQNSQWFSWIMFLGNDSLHSETTNDAIKYRTKFQKAPEFLAEEENSGPLSNEQSIYNQF